MSNSWNSRRIMKPMPSVPTMTSISVAIFQETEKP